MEQPGTADQNVLCGRTISLLSEQKLDDDYLCQVDASVSCGACCGLYNVENAARTSIQALLAARTRRFAEVPRTIEHIMQFSRETEQHESQRRPLPDFHHCPYLGFVGPRQETVGCLLHPQEPLNRGIDQRSLSYYGGMTCHIYFCPATRLLPARFKQIVRDVISDWYLYGLLVTEHRLLKALFEEIERRLNRPVFVDDFHRNPEARHALYNLFLLRVSWPFRRPGTIQLVNYFFNDHYHPRPAIEASEEGQVIERYRIILQELETRTDTAGILHQAELYLDDKFRTLQQHLQS